MGIFEALGNGLQFVGKTIGKGFNAIGNLLNPDQENRNSTPSARTITDDRPAPSPAPWRPQDFNRQRLSDLVEKIEKYSLPPDAEVSQARILMIGQIGAGKSSFVNTINSIFSGGITHLSPSGSADSSFTMVYRQHEIRPKGRRETMNFYLCDTCGIEENQGPSVDDLKYLIDGNVPDGYKFSPSAPINPHIRGFMKCPGLKDRVHCVVFVFDATVIELISAEMWNKLKQIQVEVGQREIPRVTLLTRIDKLSKAVEDDVTKAFECKAVLGAVEKVSDTLGIPRHNIHPIKNYEKEMLLNEKISRLALNALEQMLSFAKDFVDAQSLLLSKVKPWREPTPHLSRENLLKLMEKIGTYRPPSGLGVPFARILMIGPVGAGKSSFVNSVDSVFCGEISKQSVSGSSRTSLTTEYRQYKIRGYETGEYLNFRLCDTRGIEDNQGPDLAELMFLIEGNVPDGYQFNPAVPITVDTPKFIKQPKLKDKVHCVLFVFDATSVELIAQTTWEKLNQLQIRMNNKGLQRAVLLTKIDQVSKIVCDDVSKVFRNEDVHKAVHKVSVMLGIDENQIHPIKNYAREKDPTDKISNLTLLALDQILDFASAFLAKHEDTTNNIYRDMCIVFAALVALIALAITFFKYIVIAAFLTVVVCIIYASVFQSE